MYYNHETEKAERCWKSLFGMIADLTHAKTCLKMLLSRYKLHDSALDVRTIIQTLKLTHPKLKS